MRPTGRRGGVERSVGRAVGTVLTAAQAGLVFGGVADSLAGNHLGPQGARILAVVLPACRQLETLTCARRSPGPRTRAAAEGSPVPTRTGGCGAGAHTGLTRTRSATPVSAPLWLPCKAPARSRSSRTADRLLRLRCATCHTEGPDISPSGCVRRPVPRLRAIGVGDKGALALAGILPGCPRLRGLQ